MWTGLYAFIVEVAIPFLARSAVWLFLVKAWNRLGGPVLAFRVGRLLKALTRDKIGLAMNAVGIGVMWGGYKVAQTAMEDGLFLTRLSSGSDGLLPAPLVPILSMLAWYVPIKPLMTMVCVMVPLEISARAFAWKFSQMRAAANLGLGVKGAGK